MSWDTSQSVQSILRYFTIFSGTCSENSRCGKRLQNSVWALKSSAGCLPVIALKRAQREKEKRKWAKSVFSLVLGHWQAILVYLCIFSLLARSGAAYDTALPHYFSFAKVYSLWSLNRNLLCLCGIFLSKEDFWTWPNIFLLGSHGFLAFPKENTILMCVLVPHNPCFN